MNPWLSWQGGRKECQLGLFGSSKLLVQVLGGGRAASLVLAAAFATADSVAAFAFALFFATDLAATLATAFTAAA